MSLWKKRKFVYDKSEKPSRGILYYLTLVLFMIPATVFAILLFLSFDLIEFPYIVAFLCLCLILLNNSVALFVHLDRKLFKRVYRNDMVRYYTIVSSRVMLAVLPVVSSLMVTIESYCYSVGNFLLTFFLYYILFLIIAWFFLVFSLFIFDEDYAADREKEFMKKYSYYNLYKSPPKPKPRYKFEKGERKVQYTGSSYFNDLDDEEFSYLTDSYSGSHSHREQEDDMFGPLFSDSGSSRSGYIGSHGEFRVNDEMRAYREDIEQFKSSDKNFDAESHFGWEHDMDYEGDF